MNKNENNEKRIKESYENNSIIHITLTNGTWRNGKVVLISERYFVFKDRENPQEEAFFFYELVKVEPFIKKEEVGNDGCC